MTTILLICAVAALLAWAVYHSVQKARKGGGCCGEHEPAEKRTAVRDRNKSHYPYSAELEIGGMTCDRCARRVENALNELEGVWASARIGSARVRTKEKPEEKRLRETVIRAGYVVTGYRELPGPS